MVQEIIYSETRKGLFEPAPTRQQRRQDELARKRRSETIQGVLLCIGLAFCFVVYIAANFVAFSGYRL